MFNPLVTIYIVNYNYLKFLSEAVESVLNQTYQNIEVIIIDDYSTDGSREYVNRYHDYSNIRVVLNSKNLGLTKVNNIAIKLSNGDYIMRLDADDYLADNAVSILIEKFRSNSDLAMVFGNWYNIDTYGNILTQEIRLKTDELELLDSPAHGACTMFKKSVLERINGYDETIKKQDGYDIWLKIIFNYQIANVDDFIFYYRRHGSQSLSYDLSSLLETRSDLYAKFAKKNAKELKVLALVMIRSGDIENNDHLFERHGGATVLEIMLRNLSESKQIAKVILTTSDKRVRQTARLMHIPKVKVVSRPAELEYLHVKVQETYNYLRSELTLYEAVLFRSIHSPFLSKIHIDSAVNYMRIFEVSEVIAVVPEDNSMYTYTSKGMTMVFESNPSIKREGDQLYRRIPGFKLLTIENSIPIKGKIGSIIVDDISSITIKELRKLKSWKHLN